MSFSRLPVPLLLLLSAASPVLGQGTRPADRDWTFGTSVFISGISDDSDPAGYKVYSGVGLVAGVRRRLGTLLATEFSVRTESREVDIAQGGPAVRLGSLELVPMNLLLQLRAPFGGVARPYIGAGLNVTAAWEKSGVLDSMDVSPGVGPALQLGSDFALSPAVILNVDCKWNRYRADIAAHGTQMVMLKIDPLLLSAGIGFRF